MRISDWSSDVCSSDLHRYRAAWRRHPRLHARNLPDLAVDGRAAPDAHRGAWWLPPQPAPCRCGGRLMQPATPTTICLDPLVARGCIEIPCCLFERSEERRVGNEVVSTGSFRWAP